MKDAEKDAIFRLWEQAKALPECPARLALVEEAIRLADLTNRGNDALWLRLSAMTTAAEIGRDQKAFAHFAWCIAYNDRHKDPDSENCLLRNFAAMIARLGNIPHVPREQILGILDEMERRHRLHGSTLQVYWSIRRDVAMDLGDVAMARHAHRHCLRCPFDQFSLLPFDDLWVRAGYLSLNRRYREAVRLIDDFLEVSAKSLPDREQLDVGRLANLAVLGEWEEANQTYERSVRSGLRKGAYRSRQKTSILFFMGAADRFGEAKSLIRQAFADWMSDDDYWGRMEFYRAAWMSTERMRRAGIASVRITIDDATVAIIGRQSGPFDLTAEWFRDQATQLAERFDQRNGNTWCSRYVREAMRYAKRPGPGGSETKSVGRSPRSKPKGVRTSKPKPKSKPLPDDTSEPEPKTPSARKPRSRPTDGRQEQ